MTGRLGSFYGWKLGALLLSAVLMVMAPSVALAQVDGSPSEGPNVVAASSTEQAELQDVLPPDALIQPVAPSPVEGSLTFGDDGMPLPTTGEAFDYEAARQAEAEFQAQLLEGEPVSIFPVLGGGAFSSSFGAPRSEGRLHKGNDIFAPKGTPVLAVADGVVIGASTSPGGNCCWVKLKHSDGAHSVYLHLNNDTAGTDDGAVLGVAEGIVKGAKVKAGDVIGYVGDSGNAEATPPHLHFEYRIGGTDAIDPHALLAAAPVVDQLVGAVPVVAAVETLPFTGSESVPLAVAASVLIVAGVAVLRSAPRFEIRPGR